MSKLPAYATKVPVPDRFKQHAPKRKRYRDYSSVMWTCSYAVKGATETDETWVAYSDGASIIHTLTVRTRTGMVRINDPGDECLAIANDAVVFLNTHGAEIS